MPQTKQCSAATIVGGQRSINPILTTAATISTDPQSFNRYAYVQNDPVNFVDPTGLDPSFDDHLGPPPPPPIYVPYGGTIVTNTSAPRYTGGGPIFTGHFLPEDPPSEGTPGGNPGSQLPPPQEERLPFNSCPEFVDYLVKLAVNTGRKRRTRRPLVL